MHLGSSSLGGIPVSGSCPGVLRSQNGHETDKREWYQKMTLKQWQGIIRQIDDSLRILATQSLERLNSFRFKRATFYQSLKSKVGLAAANAAALRINLNVEGCSILAAPVHARSRAPLLLPLLLSHNLPLPRVL
jgi:hypothetical protein